MGGWGGCVLGRWGDGVVRPPNLFVGPSAFHYFASLSFIKLPHQRERLGSIAPAHPLPGPWVIARSERETP